MLGTQQQRQLAAELAAVRRKDHRQEDEYDEKHLSEFQPKHREGLP